jgi:hypothetical protein
VSGSKCAILSQFGGLSVDFIGREAFIRNRRAIGRAKVVDDIEAP